MMQLIVVYEGPVMLVVPDNDLEQLMITDSAMIDRPSSW